MVRSTVSWVLRACAAAILLACSAPATAQILVGPAPGYASPLRLIEPTGTRTIDPFPQFLGGVSLALGDVNGDGTVDLIAGAGPGGGPLVRVYSGTDLAEIGSFFAFDPGFGGGVHVAAGDLDGDGHADIIVGAGAGGGPHVRAFSGVDFSEVASFFPYNPLFLGGVYVASGDVDGDGHDDIITGAGPGGGPHVEVFSGRDLGVLASFWAFDPAFAGGVFVAAGDVNGDGLSDVVTGAGPGGGPHVRVIDVLALTELASFFAYDPAFGGGVGVATGDFDDDGRIDLILGAGPGGGPHVRILSGLDLHELASFFAFASGSGVSIAAVGDRFGVRFTSADAATFAAGTAGSFTIATAGRPTPTVTSGGALPAGVTFTSNGDGTATLAGTPASGSGGTYPLALTASNGIRTPATQSFTLTVTQAPAITSAATATFPVGAPGTLTVTTTGFPRPSITRTGAALPAAITFTDNGNGTGTLSGTPAPGTAGAYVVTFTASNGTDPAAVQTFTLTVNDGPGFTSAAATTFVVGSAGSFTVTTVGTPAPALSVTGALPGGVMFTDNGNGTATLTGTPGAGTAGTYPLTFTGTNSAGTNTQSFTLTVQQPPAITSAATTTFRVGAAGTFTVTATGLPTPALTLSAGTLPANVTFVDNGNGTGTLGGTPVSGTGGTYALTFTASNGAGSPVAQPFTLVVGDVPALDLDLDDDGGTSPVTGTGFAIAFAEGSPPQFIQDEVDATITDVDSPNLTSITVTITNVLDALQEKLDVDLIAGGFAANFTKTFDESTPGVAVLTIAATTPQPLAAFNTLLRRVTYQNLDIGPDTTAPRTITFVVNDGIGNSNTATTTVTILAVDQPPTATNDSYTVAEGGTLPVAAPGVLGNDTDPEGDALTAVLDAGPANAATFTLNPDGSFTYTHDASNTTTDSFTYHAFANGQSSATVTVTITITPVDDPPSITAGGTLNFTEGNPPTAIDTTIVVTDDGANLASATVQIAANYVNGQDVLAMPVTPGIGSSFDAPTGTLTLTGSATVAAYQAALRTVTYFNGSNAPSPLPRTVAWIVNDGASPSNAATSTINVTPVDDPPTADNDSYTVAEGATLTVPAPGVLDGDVDPEGDALTAVLVTGPANASSFTLNADGSFTYTHNGSETTTDSFTYRAVANGLPSAPATVTITITPVNDAPAITAGGTLNFVEGNPPTAIDTTILVTDADDIFLESAMVQIAANYVNGQDVLAMPVTAGIASSFNATTGTLTLTGSAPVAAYQSALRSVTYFNNSASPSVAPRTVTWVVNDGTVSSNIATSTITVTAVNSAPIGGADAWTTFGNTELAVDQAGPATPFIADTTTSTFGVLDNDTDPEGDPRVVIGIVGCADTTAPFVCATTAGGTVTMDSNGRFTYRPQAGDTGFDNFQYVLADLPSAGAPGSVNVPVNLTLQERIWYVNGGVAGPGTGTSDDPFRDLPATAGDADDYIFVHDSTVTGGITLQNGQKLYGEGFGLSINQALNGNPAPAVLVAPGNNPVINATTGNAVGVLANTANGSLTNLEIRGLALSTAAAGSNAIDVTSANAANVAVTISDVAVNGATAEGIDINQASTGSATVSMTNVTVTSTGTGIDLNRTTGTLTVTGFSGITITGATAGAGITVSGATFDGTAGGAYQQIAGGSIVVGSQADPVGGAGIVMTGVSGDLGFTDLDIFTSNGPGLQVTGTGTLNGGAGTGMGIAVAAGVADLQSVGGPALNINNATATLPLDSVTVTSSLLTGINLSGASGTVSATSGSITNTAGIAVSVSGGTVSLNYGGNITQTNNVAMVSVSGGHTTGTITFSGTLNATNGTGLQFDNADSTTSYNFTGTTTLNGGDAGIDILNNSSGTFSFGAGTTITNPSGTAFQLSGSNANVTYSGTITDNTGFAVDIDGHTAGTVTFQTGSIASTGNGVLVSNNTGGAINFNSPTITLTTGGNKAVTLDTGNVGGAINFAPAGGGSGLDISTTTGTGFSGLGGGTISVTGTGNTINATTGTAIDLAGVIIGAGGVNFGTTSSGGGTRNVKLTSVTGAGTVALGGGALTGASGAAFLVGDGAGGANSGGTAAISYSGTITTTGTARAVDIQDRAAAAGSITLSGTITHGASGNTNVVFLDDNAAGTITFSGAGSVLNGGTSTAVSLTDNTGATIDFTGGGLDIDASSGSGFVATGGGTVNVTGSVNTITTTIGTALNVANTNIGSSGLTFRSITAGTGAGSAGNALVLDNTGTAAGNGGLTVTGNAGAGTGGTIQHKTGANGSTADGIGIYLNRTKNASFSWMQLNHFDNFAIRGNELNGLTLSNVVVNGTSGNDAGSDEGAVFLEDSGGTIAITNSNVSGGFEDNLRVDYNNAVAGPAATFNVSGSTFRDLQAAGQNAQVNLRSQTSAGTGWVVAFTFTSNTFENDANTLPPGGTENWSDGILVTFEGPFAHDLTVESSTFHHLFQGMDIASNFSADVDYVIRNNTITFTEGVAAIAIGNGSSSTAQSFLTALIQGNTIGTSGVAQSGNRLGQGIIVDVRGEETAQFTIHGNTIRRIDVGGIDVLANTGDGDLNIQITDNVIAEVEDDVGAGISDGMRVLTATGSLHDICLDARNNDSFNLSADDLQLRQSNAGVVFAIEGLTGSGASAANVEAFLDAQNPLFTPASGGTRVRTVASVVNFTSVASCTTPTPQ